MILKIKDVKDKGTDKERVVLNVVEDGDIGMYMLLNTIQVGEEKVASEVSKPFWIPDMEVKEKDLVIVYTKKGKSGFRTNEHERTSYFFYRNIDTPIYGGDEVPLLVEINNWGTEQTP